MTEPEALLQSGSELKAISEFPPETSLPDFRNLLQISYQLNAGQPE
jgi:hypothetical protein